MMLCFFFFSSRRRHTRCALVTGVQTCALPISNQASGRSGSSQTASNSPLPLAQRQPPGVTSLAAASIACIRRKRKKDARLLDDPKGSYKDLYANHSHYQLICSFERRKSCTIL